MEDLYNQIKQQNKNLSQSVNTQSENNSSNVSFTNYELTEIQSFQTINSYLFIIFYCVAAILIFIIITYNPLNIYLKIFIVIFIALFPFIIYTIEYIIYYLLSYIYSLITFTPFNSVYLTKYQPKSYESLFNNRYYQL
jgi:hypothetical protein